jgi:hypothetical protein
LEFWAVPGVFVALYLAYKKIYVARTSAPAGTQTGRLTE